MLSESKDIHVVFLSQDLGFTDPLARALGAEFETRASNESQSDRLPHLQDWCDVVLLDLRPTRAQGDCESGLRLLDSISKLPSHPPIIAFCEEGNRQVILTAIDRGAYDTVTNPLNMIELRLILRRAYRFRAAEQEIEQLKANGRTEGFHELLGMSAPMQELFALAQKIAPCDVNVLITGETGTGKELLARTIHHMSTRSARPIVAFSCANLPESLIEDELFGHEKGAFTGAFSQRRGRMEAADQSTLFLDEIGDLSLELQPKLLRVLQERNFERLGSNNTVNVDIRLICATNRNLSELVKEGKFREDLYYRLNVMQMHLPPLRERRDDIRLLAQHFLEKFAEMFNKKKVRRFSQAALIALEEYDWPGNVRELSNAVQRAVVLSEGLSVEISQLPVAIRSERETPQGDRYYEEAVREFKRRLVLRTLRECGWRKTETARMLGVARGYLHRLINQLGIQNVNEEDPVEVQTQPPPPRIM
jgi:DNA-binding NtrC family response regulator